MGRLVIFVCENFEPEYDAIVERNRFKNVVIKSFSSLCENQGIEAKAKVKQDLFGNLKEDDYCVVFCSTHCSVLNLVHEKCKVVKTDYCFSHLINDKSLEYILGSSGYIVSIGWLRDWRKQLNNMGFNQDLARKFFKETSTELVFLDSNIDKNAKNYLEELANYVDLPYKVLPTELNTLDLIVKGVVADWRLEKLQSKSQVTISSLQAKSAEYAALLDILEKLTQCIDKDEVVEKMKGVFIGIFGATIYKFHEGSSFLEKLLAKAKTNNLNMDSEVFLFNDTNEMYILIQQGDILHGIVEAREFLSPEYLRRYSGFALSIAKISGFVLTDIIRYEELVKYKDRLEYIGYHDSLTDLYNRAYVNKALKEEQFQRVAIFSMDIDGLKYVNDNFGHAEGDKLIASLADVLKSAFRETDIVARFGGDEFIALVRECDEELAASLKNRVTSLINKHNNSGVKEHLKIRLSVGYVTSEKIVDDMSVLIKKADVKMYEEKRKKVNKRS